MEIRNYKDEDFLRVEELLKITGLYYEPLDKKHILKKKIEHDPESIMLLEDRDRLVGMVFMIYDPFESFVFHLGVHPDFRGRGLGNKLMDEVENRLKSRGIKRPTLYIEEENEGVVDFYKKRGWYVLYKVFCMEKDL